MGTNVACFVGLDLGQRQDYTALAVVDRGEVETGFDRVRYQRVVEKRTSLRFLERLPLGTPYTEVATRVGALMERLGDMGPGVFGGMRWFNVVRATLVVDATGVGAPVVDLLKEARLGCELVGVTITGGERAARDLAGWRVPKRDLVTGLQVMLEQGRLRIASGVAQGATLMHELRNMRVQVTAGRNEGFAAWREGEHDDLVLAVALACWRARFGECGEMGRPLGVEK